MKKLLLLLFLIIFSSTSIASWIWVETSQSGNEYYIDFETIKKNNGYHYFYSMTDLLEPDTDGDLSYSIYRKVDCKSSRFMTLSEFYYTGNMGEGGLTTNNNNTRDWIYPPPGSVSQIVIKELCDYVK